MSKLSQIIFSFLFTLVFFSCQEDDFLPKPKAFLALEFPEAQYYQAEINCDYNFKINSIAKLKSDRYNKDC
jgi:hypothetical protein